MERADTLLTMRLGPAEVLVAVKADSTDAVTGAEIESIAGLAARRPHER